MVKQILMEITHCSKCPYCHSVYLWMNFCRHPKLNDLPDFKKRIVSDNCIPSWCVLEEK